MSHRRCRGQSRIGRLRGSQPGQSSPPLVLELLNCLWLSHPTPTPGRRKCIAFLSEFRLKMSLSWHPEQPQIPEGLLPPGLEPSAPRAPPGTLSLLLNLFPFHPLFLELFFNQVKGAFEVLLVELEAAEFGGPIPAKRKKVRILLKVEGTCPGPNLGLCRADPNPPHT